MTTMNSVPDEMNKVNITPCVGDDVDRLLKYFPSLNEPCFKEHLVQLLGHPSFHVAVQQLKYLDSPATENEYDEHAYRIAMEEVWKSPDLEEGFRKLPPLPDDFLTFLNDLSALEKKLANESGTDLSDMDDKKFLLQVRDALDNYQGVYEALQGGTNMEELDYMGRTSLEVACTFGKLTQEQRRPLETL